MPFQQGDLSLTKNFYPVQQCDALLSELIDTVDWHQDYFEAFGRRFEIPRLQAWFADDGIQYSYANNLLTSQPWTPALLAIKHDVERVVGFDFNAVLLTLYRNGGDHVTWHADDEHELGGEPVIASLSLGATRQFQYRHKTENLSEGVFLENGDLLLMRPGFQHHWQHCVPSEPEVQAPRINLTFRKVVNLGVES